MYLINVEKWWYEKWFQNTKEKDKKKTFFKSFFTVIWYRYYSEYLHLNYLGKKTDCKSNIPGGGDTSPWLWSWLQFFFLYGGVKQTCSHLVGSCDPHYRSAAVHLTVPLYGREEEPPGVSRETQTRRPPLRTGTQSASNDERGETVWRHTSV